MHLQKMARLLSLYLNMIIYKIHTYVKNVISIKIDYGPQCTDEKSNKSVEDKDGTFAWW